MADVEGPDAFPRRDEHDRVVGLPDLLGLTIAAFVSSLFMAACLGVVGAVAGWGGLAWTSWFGLAMPVWLFWVEGRAWRAVSARLVVVVSGGLVAMALGLLIAEVASAAPWIASQASPLWASYAAGAATAALAYAVWWYYGIRWLARREGILE